MVVFNKQGVRMDWSDLLIDIIEIRILSSRDLRSPIRCFTNSKELQGIICDFFPRLTFVLTFSKPLIDGLLLIWLFFLQVLPSQQITSQALSERSLRCRTPFWPRTFRLLSQLQEGCLCFCTSFISSISEYFRSGFIRLPWPIFQRELPGLHQLVSFLTYSWNLVK